MYFLAVFAISWIWWFISADKHRVRELFGAAIWSSFLGLLTDLIMVHYQLWSYRGLPAAEYTIPLLLDFGIYPVVTYLFVQWMPEDWWGIMKRAVIWSAAATLFEFVTLKVGVMEHHQWWSMWLSFTADMVIFWSIAGIYRYYRPAYRSREKASQV